MSLVLDHIDILAHICGELLLEKEPLVLCLAHVIGHGVEHRAAPIFAGPNL